VGPGDEVVTSSLSAAFTGLAVLSTGAHPVFVDVDTETLNLDPGAFDPGRRGRVPGPWGTLPGPPGGDPGHVRGPVVLPDQEPGRPRRRGGSPGGRSGARGAAAQAPQRGPE
jgi:hypothetical protein